MIRVGGDALDHELPARDANRQHRVFGEQAEQGARDGVDCAVEERMADGIDRVLVQGDRKLDQKVAELAREGRRRSVGRGDAMPAPRRRELHARGGGRIGIIGGGSTGEVCSDEGHAPASGRYSILTTEPLHCTPRARSGDDGALLSSRSSVQRTRVRN